MYVVINNKKIVVKVASSWKEKINGLMNKVVTYGLLIPKCNHIHTFFMKDNIDILVLDERNSILYKYMNMPRNRTFKFYEDIEKTSILELPKNTSLNLRIGDILSFESEHII